MRGPSSATCPSTLFCSCSSRVCRSTAMASSRERMPSSRSDSSSSGCAIFCCDLTISRRSRRRAISPRIFSIWSAAALPPLSAKRNSGSMAAAVHKSSLRRVLTQGLLRRLLLRLFLRRPFAARQQAPHLHLDDEALVVIGSDLIDDVVLRKRQPLPLRELLQRGLVIVEEEVVGVDALDVVAERSLDERARGLDAGVEIDRRDHRFEEVRQQRVLLPPARLLLADAEVDDLAHAVVARLGGEAGGAHEIRLDLRERPFIDRGKAMEEQVADDEAEDGVAEELERLVVADVALLRLVRVRLVRQRAREELAPREAVADALLETGQVVLQAFYCVARDPQPSPVTLSTELA